MGISTTFANSHKIASLKTAILGTVNTCELRRFGSRFRFPSARHFRGMIASGCLAMWTMNVDGLLHFDFYISLCLIGKESDRRAAIAAIDSVIPLPRYGSQKI